MTREWTAEEELEIAEQASAMLVNRFWLVPLANGSVRIMFMERSSSGRRQYARCAVVIGAADAHALSDLIRQSVPLPKSGASAFLELAPINRGRKN